MHKNSGPLLFAFFAAPCAGDRFFAGQMTQKDLQEFEECVKNKIEPRTELLERCFPNATKDLKGWSFEEVSDYCKNHHRHEGDCAVHQGVVFGISRNYVQIQYLSKMENVLNPYGFTLEIGDTVLFHRKVVFRVL